MCHLLLRILFFCDGAECCTPSTASRGRCTPARRAALTIAQRRDADAATRHHYTHTLRTITTTASRRS